MGNWDFTADSDIQKELADKLYVAADNFDDRVSQMYTQIDNMGTQQAWVGEDYDLFKLGCEGYKGAISDLGDSFRMYAKHFEKISSGTENLANELINIVNNMTNIDVVNLDELISDESTGNNDNSYREHGGGGRSRDGYSGGGGRSR